MSRLTKRQPERGSARSRLLGAACDIIRQKGFAATSVDDLCTGAQVTKGAFFHHFESKEALGVAAAAYWQETTAALFAGAPYHAAADPLERILAYIAFRRALISDNIARSSCLVGMMVQEVHNTAPAIRDACAASIFGHAGTLEADFDAALRQHGISGVTAASLARHTQTVIQGAFVVAKAAHNTDLAREGLDHLERYVRLLFSTTINGADK
jgi:TetR/AcrR family transcriptional repressor of nem operon